VQPCCRFGQARDDHAPFWRRPEASAGRLLTLRVMHLYRRTGIAENRVLLARVDLFG
jgi:hypothetical protein